MPDRVEIYQNTTAVIPFEVKGQDGEPLDLTGYQAEFVLKRAVSDASTIDERTSLNNGGIQLLDQTLYPGRGEVIIPPSATVDFEEGPAWYDIIITRNGQRYKFLPNLEALIRRPVNLAGATPPEPYVPPDLMPQLIALWADTHTRYLCISPVHGNDANVGYIDAPHGTEFDPAAVRAIAVKTTTVLNLLIPRNGNNRNLVILINPAGPNQVEVLDQDGNLGLIDLTGVVRRSYGGFWIRASDFTNSVDDRTRFACMVAVPGPNADQSWTVQSWGAPVITVAAGSLPTDYSLCAYTVRNKGNVTSGMAGRVHRAKWGRASNQLEIGGVSLINFHAPGDEFFIEKPSVRMRGIIGGLDVCNTRESAVSVARSGAVVAGITFAHATGDVMDVSNGKLKSCQFVLNGTFFSISSNSYWNLGATYTDETGVSRVAYASFAATHEGGANTGTLTIFGGTSSEQQNQFNYWGGQMRFTTFGFARGAFGLGAATFHLLSFYGCDMEHRTFTNSGIGGGGNPNNRLLCRGTGVPGVSLQDSEAVINNIEFGNCSNAVETFGKCGGSVQNLTLNGTLTNVGMSVPGWGSMWKYGGGCDTLIGPNGQFVDRDGSVAWASIPYPRREDSAGNRVVLSGE